MLSIKIYMALIFIFGLIPKIKLETCTFIGCKCETKCLNLEETCSMYEIVENIECDGGANTLEFPSRNNIYDNDKIYNFTIKNYNFKQIPDFIFNNLIIKNLFLINNGLEIICDNAFKGFRNSTNQNTINNIIFRENNIKKIEPIALYKNFLDSIDFSECKLTDERMDDLFSRIEPLNSIYEIKFDNNQISYINRTWIKYVKY